MAKRRDWAGELERPRALYARGVRCSRLLPPTASQSESSSPSTIPVRRPACLERLCHYAARIRWESQYIVSMRIPHTRLSAVVLRAVVQEFVTRDGTDHSSVERRIEAVLGQLDGGSVELHFDAEAETCNIVPVEGKPTADRWAKQRCQGETQGNG